MDSYWSRVLNGRMARRRALAVTGSSALGAALLAACGGSDSGGTPKDVTSLVAKPEDTTKVAKRGGTFKDFHTSDPATMDPVNPVNPLNPPTARVYSTLVREKAGYLEPSKAELGGDIAESWESSPDRLTITMKLRPGVKWHNKAPVSGRTLDADDVIFSYNRFAEKGALRGMVVNSFNPTAPVLSVTSPDAKTIVIKLKEPLVYSLELFASFGSLTGGILMVPKETDSSFDIRRDTIGTGPYTMTNYAVSQGFTYKRNEAYYDPEFTYFDGIDMPIITEYAAQLSQFKAGNIHYFTPRNEDLTAIKSEDPRLKVYQTDPATNANVVTFGQFPEGKSPFTDERVRQAISMSWDRDLFIDTFYNVSNFRNAGLPQDTRWNSSLQTYWEGWWLDPQGKDFGANSKYYQFNIAEGKKLLAAAGYPNGLTVTSRYIQGVQLGDLPKNAEVLDGMTKEIGLTIKIDPIDYNKDYIPLYRDGSGQYEGWSYHTVSGTTPIRISPVSALAAPYWSKAGLTFDGFSTTGKNDMKGDPQVDALIEKARLEPDIEKRRSLVQDIQRYLAKPMYGLMLPGGATGFTVGWPAYRNYQVYRGGPGIWRGYKAWLDDTQPPIKQS